MENKQNSKKLWSVIKHVINKNKRIKFQDLRSNTEKMYKCSGIMKLDYINTYLVGKFMYKVYHKIIPAIFDGFFKYNYHIHDHYTRTANHLHVPLTGKNYLKQVSDIKES